MNTALMEAYEALGVICEKRKGYDPQVETLTDVMDVIWNAMGKDEQDIINARLAK